jgi:hypothetical protein
VGTACVCGAGWADGVIAACWTPDFSADLTGGTAGSGRTLAPWAMPKALAPASTAAPNNREVAVRIINLDLRPKRGEVTALRQAP